MAANSELMKQYRTLVRTIGSFSNGQAAIAEAPSEEEEDSLEIIYVTISPNDGPYAGGKFLFKLDLSDDYPEVNPPKINCLTRVYHPNIDQIDEYSEGDICLNLLDELWTPELTLEDYIQGLLFMFYNPNVEDPLNPAFNGTETEEEFQENVARSMRGEEVDGTVYEKVLPSDSNEVTVADTKDTVATPIDTPTETSGEEVVMAPTSTQVVSKSEDIPTAPGSNRDEATGQHEEEEVLVEKLKMATPSLIPRLPISLTYMATPPRDTRQLLKEWMSYGLTFVLVRVGVLAGFHLLKRVPIK